MKEDNYDFVETDLPNVGPGGMVIPLPNVIDENEIPVSYTHLLSARLRCVGDPWD